MREELKQTSPTKAESQPATHHAANTAAVINPEAFIQGVQQLMWNKVGIVRSGESLQQATAYLQSVEKGVPALNSRRSGEARNIHTVAQLITRSALARLESRGAHYRTDWPAHDDARFKKHSIIGKDGIRFV